MRFLVDKNGGLVVPNWLRSQGHEVFAVYESARGIDDDAVIQKAFDEDWILISSDKDFGNGSIPLFIRSGQVNLLY
ncbi:DUF5615 family PIN-like protein [Chamaesiphon sp. OTE_8_metabat_110]|uniref:DUF5615 family PIN-like protein n=1 Tax=Chamaesiphon sp. OTE_8_metabat_110 TaxID=2964696 RepID=UPI00286AD336|nr:DUF5615 family PIN-like protein [Chamaesiphon sp. OTE_8_metabat_110]